MKACWNKKYLPREKLSKVPFIIHADLECQLKKLWSWQNNFENSYTEKKKITSNLQDTHGAQHARLMRQMTSAIFIGEKIVLKIFVKI